MPTFKSAANSYQGGADTGARLAEGAGRDVRSVERRQPSQRTDPYVSSRSGLVETMWIGTPVVSAMRVR